MAAIQHSLARANGWGSAGQCPAIPSAKTPAARESGATSWRSSGGRIRPGGDASPDGTAQLFQLQAELEALRAAACAYYVRSDLRRNTAAGQAAADHLAQLLGYPEDIA
jgi:hypothetical protein